MDFKALMEKKKAEREAAGVVGTQVHTAIAEEKKKEDIPPKALTFMEQLAAKAAAKSVEAVVNSPVGMPEIAPIPKVITAANLANKNTIGQEEAEISGETKQALDNIRQKIFDMQEMNNGELNGAMSTLREMLRANPAACSLMLPEDVGLMVRSLRKMTGNTQALVMGQAKTRKTSTKEKELSLEEVMELAKSGGTDGWD